MHGSTVREDAGEEVGETERVDGLGRGVQIGEGPPAVFADVVGLRGPGRVDVGWGDAGEEILFDLADLTAADEVVLAALRELRSQFDRLLVDTEFFAQLTERRGDVAFPVLQ